MITRTVVWLALAASTGRLAADPLDAATLAAMRLSDDANYSWNSSVQDDARSYLKQGKHVRGSYTWVTLPMIDCLARRLGRNADTEIEAIFRDGTDECVIRLGDRWKTVKQLPRVRDRDDLPMIITPPPGLLPSSDPFPSMIVVTPPRDSEENKPYSNARLAASAPHEELALIVSSWVNVVVNGPIVRGRLSDTGARLLLCPGSEFEARPVVAAGEFMLWIEGPRVKKYQLVLEGVLRVGKKNVHVVQTSETAISAIGGTAFIVPDEARLKLEN